MSEAYDLAELNAALEPLKPVLGGAMGIEALDQIWLESETLSATNGRVGVVSDLRTDLSCGVPGAAFLKFIAGLSGDEVTLVQNKSDLEVVCGRMKARFPILDIKEKVWPFVDLLGVESIMLDEDLQHAVQLMLDVKMTTPRRPEHRGVLMRFHEGKLELYATDSVTMMRYVCIEKMKPTFQGYMLLPWEFVTLVAKMKQADEPFLVAARTSLEALAGPYSVHARWVDPEGVYDLAALTESVLGAKPRFIPVPEGFMNAVEQAIVVGGKECKIHISVDKDVMSFRGKFEKTQFSVDLDVQNDDGVTGFVKVTPANISSIVGKLEEISFTERAIVFNSGGLTYCVAVN